MDLLFSSNEPSWFDHPVMSQTMPSFKKEQFSHTDHANQEPKL